MTRRVFTDRSRVEQFQRCPRSRYLAYHQDGRGIQSQRKPLPLVVGGSVHKGLESLLNGCDEEQAVLDALTDFSLHADALEIDTFESAAMILTMRQDACGLYMTPLTDEERIAEQRVVEDAFGRYLRDEQAALVEAMVRAYCRRRLQPLLAEFEVLEVEREGEWLLGEISDADKPCSGEDGILREFHSFVAREETGNYYCENCGRGKRPIVEAELWFMSRPDALLRERATNQLYLLSYKTAATWDIRKQRDAEHDMQGLSEGVEVERRLAHWWHVLHDDPAPKTFPEFVDRIWGEAMPQGNANAIINYLRALDAPPRIHAIRYEYLLKGSRRRDKDLSQRLGVDAYAQDSHLVRQYAAVSTPAKGTSAYAIGDVCWSWDYTRVEDMRDGSLAWQNWRRRPVWEHGSVREWIDQLDAAAPVMSGEDSTIGMEPSQIGWSSPAQSLGVTRAHPLDSVFLPPVVIYRHLDELRDWIEQVESQERTVAGHVAAVESAGDEGERRHLLNVHFPQSRHACEYPGTCQFARVCWGGAEMQADPLASGKYKPREVNHLQELEGDK